MPGPLFAANDRVELRSVEGEDYDDIARDMNHPDVRVTGGGSIGPADSEAVAEFVDRYREDGNVGFVVHAEGSYVGMVTLVGSDFQGNVAVFGVWITPEAQGRGYGTAAGETLFDWAFDHRGLHKIVATVFAFNDVSKALMETLGFTEEGIHREERFANGEFHDVHYFGLLDREWRERRA